MGDNRLQNDRKFEQDVREIAIRLWPSAEGGADMIDGKERDGVYYTDEAVHIIEATTSRSLEKARIDSKKISKIIPELQRQNPDCIIKGWFITKDEPTADQLAAVKKSGSAIQAISFKRFQGKLIDVWEYIQCRNNYPFGSVRDPNTGNYTYQDEYVDLVLEDSDSKSFHKTKEIAEKVTEGNEYVITGHYGVGKSMALKKIYEIIVKKYNNHSLKFPVFINLRDHQGQTDAVEAIYRHAKNIGFKKPEHIIRAWRAGYVIMILDGFDEMAAFGWAGVSSKLREIRYKSMELIRSFRKNQNHNSGLIISGRINYFDSKKECINALNLGSSYSFLHIGDFTEDQLIYYLKNKKIESPIPKWIPRRPLLLSYIVAKGIIIDAVRISDTDLIVGWDYLFNKISEREAAIESGISPELIREIIEGLACVVRKYQSGLGPISQVDMEQVFLKKCGYEPDDRALVLLQRLPGLTVQDQQDGTRYFIDTNFVEVAKAGEIHRYILNPYDFCFSSDAKTWVAPLDEVGISMLSYLTKQCSSGLFEAAITNALDLEWNVLATDLLLVMFELGYSWKRENIAISNIYIQKLELSDDVDWSRIIFKECIINELIIHEQPKSNISPKFQYCIIGNIVGCSDVASNSSNVFIECEIENYESVELTTSSLLSLNLPLPVNVCFTILKKLFFQAGGGRLEKTLNRGLDQKQQRYVPEILMILKQEGFAYQTDRAYSDKIWQPERSMKSRVIDIVQNKNLKDPLILKIRSLSY
jgi:hypothetical protein